MKEIKVGLLGCGTVGTGVAKILIENKDLIRSRLGAALNLQRVADIDLKRDRGVQFADGVLI
ncbi:MAG: homoserine dehydrogenase, partial [Proteobacteria bacterium]|nr:homoserine dehydrogenase [Pseudomonadota bacterium]